MTRRATARRWRACYRASWARSVRWRAWLPSGDCRPGSWCRGEFSRGWLRPGGRHLMSLDQSGSEAARRGGSNDQRFARQDRASDSAICTARVTSARRALMIFASTGGSPPSGMSVRGRVRHSRQRAQANPIPRLLLDYDAGPRHDLAERRHLALHEAGEFGGRAADHLEPEIDHPATHLRHADNLD
jgi:hypothetical protein